MNGFSLLSCITQFSFHVYSVCTCLQLRTVLTMTILSLLVYISESGSLLSLVVSGLINGLRDYSCKKL